MPIIAHINNMGIADPFKVYVAIYKYGSIIDRFRLQHAVQSAPNYASIPIPIEVKVKNHSVLQIPMAHIKRY